MQKIHFWKRKKKNQKAGNKIGLSIHMYKTRKQTNKWGEAGRKSEAEQVFEHTHRALKTPASQE